MHMNSIRSKQSDTVSSSNSFPNPSAHLDVDHKETLNVPSNSACSSTTRHGSGVPYVRDPYSNRLILEWELNLRM
jgi:hypothetical protein